MKKIFILLLCYLMIFIPVFARGTKEETGEFIGTTVGLVGGSVVTGAAIGSIVPGIGSIIGAAVGGALAGLGVGSLGGTIGGAIGRALTYDGSEFINVKTSFDYVQLGAERIENIVYKSSSADSTTSTTVPFSNDFIYGNDVVVSIFMTPEIIDEKADIPNTGLDIPVFIYIETTDSVSYKREGGLANVYEEVDENGNKYLYTIIKSTVKDAEISFRFCASAPGEAKLTVLFGTFEDRLIVTQNSNQTRTIRFIEY